MRLLLSPNDEDMVLLNPLTLDKRDMRGSRVGNYRVEGRGSPRGREVALCQSIEEIRGFIISRK